MVTLIKYSILSVAFSPRILESQHKTTEDHKQLTADWEILDLQPRNPDNNNMLKSRKILA